MILSDTTLHHFTAMTVPFSSRSCRTPGEGNMLGQPLRGPVKILCRVNRVKLRSYSGRISQIQQVRKKDILLKGQAAKGKSL